MGQQGGYPAKDIHKQFIENAPDILYAFSDKRGGVFYTPVVEKILGYKMDYLYRHPFLWFESIHPDDKPEIEKVIDDFARGINFDIQYRIKNSKGEWLWFRDRSIGRTENNNEVIIHGIATDVTKARKAEEALKESEGRFKGVVNNIGLGVSLISPKMEILSLNKQMREWFPKIDDTTKPICFKSFNDPPRDDICPYCPSRKTLEDGKIHESVTDTPTSEGIVHYRIIATPLKDDRGKVVAAIEMVEDITTQVKYEKAITESEHKFRGAFETSPIGMALVSLEGKWLQVNRALCDIVGYSREELYEKTFQDITHPDDLQEDLGYVQELLEGKIDSYQMEKRYYHKDGRPVWVILGVSLVKDGEKKPLYFVSQIVDISSRKKLEEELEQSNRELKNTLKDLKQAQKMLVRAEKLSSLGRLAAGAAHEILNPLNIIGAICQTMRLDERTAEDEENLKVIMKQVDRAAKITADMKRFSRKKEKSFKPVDIVALLEKTLELIEYDIKLDNITIKRIYQDDVPPVSGDRDSLAQVFLNLISNARDAMVPQKKGTISISVSKIDGGVEVTFADDGPGIPAKTAKKIFDPFFTTKDAGKGTGLGLSVVNNIIKGHKGTITLLENESPGTCFKILIPAK